MWLDSDTLKKGYAVNIYYNLRIRVWKHDMSSASEKIILVEIGGEISRYISWRLNVAMMKTIIM